MLNLTKTSKKVLALFFAPLLIILIIVFLNRDKKSETEIITNIDEEEYVLVVNSKQITEKNDNNIIDISYPEISGLSREEVEVKINQDIKTEIENIKDDFKSRSESIELSFDGESTLDVLYEDIKTYKNIISIPFLISEYNAGSAHPFSFKMVIHFDITNGKVLKLDDFFVDNYLDSLSSVTRNNLVQHFNEKEWELSGWENEGTAPNVENFEQFYFTEDELIVIFNPYQVAAYVYGIIEIPVDLSEINSILLEKYK